MAVVVAHIRSLGHMAVVFLIAPCKDHTMATERDRDQHRTRSKLAVEAG
jgi:hypothetical protein